MAIDHEQSINFHRFTHASGGQLCQQAKACARGKLSDHLVWLADWAQRQRSVFGWQRADRQLQTRELSYAANELRRCSRSPLDRDHPPLWR